MADPHGQELNIFSGCDRSRKRYLKRGYGNPVLCIQGRNRRRHPCISFCLCGQRFAASDDRTDPASYRRYGRYSHQGFLIVRDLG